MVETANGRGIGEVRRPGRELPESKRERLYRRVVRMASETEVRESRERRERETRAVGTCQQMARGRGLQLKVVDVEMQPAARRVTVYFNADERVDFRELVRDLAEVDALRSEEHTSELQSQSNLVCRLLLEKKKNTEHMKDRH